VGKGKLSKFEEMKSFGNVFQPEFNAVYGKDYRLKGRWAEAHFNNDHPVILELGCGKGEYTVGLAKLFAAFNFIGVDIKGARMWTGAKMALSENLSNVAFIRTRIEFITSFFGRDEIEEIWLTFPDPQLKKRRNKKRLTAPRFLGMYQEFLKDGGLIHLKTDNPVMYHYTRELARINNLPLEFATDDLYGHNHASLVHGIQTFYERQFLEEGLNIHYLKFRLPHKKVIIEPELDEPDT
jgi:tRNA (guanine-N7-)-methyltransferase